MQRHMVLLAGHIAGKHGPQQLNRGFTKTTGIVSMAGPHNFRYPKSLAWQTL